jgi:hypothetical protein
VGTGAGLDVLQKRHFSCGCQDLKPRSSSIYPSHCTDYDAPYWFEGHTKVHINNMRWEVGLDVFDS